MKHYFHDITKMDSYASSVLGFDTRKLQYVIVMAMLYHRKPLNENIRTCLLCYIRATVLQSALYFCDHYNLIRKQINYPEQKLK